ncbi:MAG: endospore germination permease [Ectobacillus sp.]
MKFSPHQLLFVLILSLGISNHVLLLPHLLKIAKRDSWICILIGYAILIAWGFLLHLIMKKNEKQKLSSWLKERTNGIISGFIILLFFIYIVVSGTFTFYDFVQTIDIYFLPLTPVWVIAISFLLLCISIAYYNLKTIVYMSVILLPFVWILGIFVALGTLEEKNYSYIFPILSQGTGPIVEGTLIFLGGSVDLLLILLLQQHANKSFSFFTIFMLITLLAVLTLGPALGSIASFGPNVAAELRFPAFEQWRLIIIGQYVSHLDFLAVFQLLSGSTLRIALFLFLIYDIFDVQSNVVKKTILFVYSIILAVVSIYPISDIWVTQTLRYYVYPSSIIFGGGITLVLLAVSYLLKKKGVDESI